MKYYNLIGHLKDLNHLSPAISLTTPVISPEGSSCNWHNNIIRTMSIKYSLLDTEYNIFPYCTPHIAHHQGVTEWAVLIGYRRCWLLSACTYNSRQQGNIVRFKISWLWQQWDGYPLCRSIRPDWDKTTQWLYLWTVTSLQPIMIENHLVQ